MKYGLMLNDMREPNIENIQCVKVATNKQELIDWYNSQLADKGWRDGNWYKVFKQGSQLEWANPVSNFDTENDYWGGIWTFKDEAPDEAILQFALGKG
jgi:hypothetical protein